MSQVQGARDEEQGSLDEGVAAESREHESDATETSRNQARVSIVFFGKIIHSCCSFLIAIALLCAIVPTTMLQHPSGFYYLGSAGICALVWGVMVLASGLESLAIPAAWIDAPKDDTFATAEETLRETFPKTPAGTRVCECIFILARGLANPGDGDGAEEIIISDSALQGVLSSHNALAKKFLELQQGFDEWKKKEEEAAQQRALDEERRQQEAKAAEEQQQNMAERLKTLEDQVAEQGKTQETLKEKIPELEEKREQIEGLQKSIGEILKKEEEMMSKVLPEWEAALSVQIKKLGEEVTSFKQGMEDRMAELEKTGNTRHEALAEEFRAVEPRLTPLLDALKQRLDATDDNLAKLGERLSESTAENVASLEQLSAQLKASAEAAEAFANKQDELVVGDFKERFDGRLKDLEGALKQSEYVNLIFQDRFKTELAAAAEQLTDLYRARDLLNGDVAQLRTDAMAPLAPLQEAQQQLRGVTAKLEEGLAACQAKAAELAGSFATTAAQQSASQGSLKGRVEADLQRLETSARAETQHLLQMIRANEVAVEQLKQLEGQVVEERRERQELRARLEKEERDRQAEIVTCQWMAEKRAQDVELGANSRFESVRQALDELVVEFQGFVKSDSSRAMDVSRLEALVRALEVRVWPWRNGSKERSPSSRSARPGWSQESMPNLVVGPNNPVGPAISAARAARVGVEEPFN